MVSRVMSRPARSVSKALGVAGLLLVLLSCIQSSQTRIAVPAYAIAAPPGEVRVGGWTVTLTVAELGFGPVYFCAASSGSATLCETAAAELRTISTVNMLTASPQFLGNVDGLTGGIRSASFDFGITWYPTQASAVAAPSSARGHSVYLEGKARRGTDILPFTALIDVVAQFRGQRAVPTVAAVGVVSESTSSLEVHFDVAKWLLQIDFDRVPPGPLVIGPTSAEHNAIAQAMVATRPPEFVWTQSP